MTNSIQEVDNQFKVHQLMFTEGKRIITSGKL